MWIYKITDIQNNKVYIGQTIRPIEQRFRRHMNDALNNILDTHFARAIRKYGKDSFIIKEIDSAQTQDELNKKEQYWIQYYNSIEDGYNETDAISKCGGNTYQSKTEEKMEVIKEKIRQTKLGSKNPMARKIKRINIITNEVEIFDTVISCAKACGIKNGKTSITTRLNGQVKSPFKKRWIFEYYDE
jgi:group I intron endonuclease